MINDMRTCGLFFIRGVEEVKPVCYITAMNGIYISSVGDGHNNLAADEYLLELYRQGSMHGVTLYFYVNTNAVIIGRNQNAWRECNIEKMRRDGVQLVRRHTGGGAVYHDSGNLNFSFITDESSYDKERQTRVILNACKALGVDAQVSGRNDLTVNRRKFSGCAYALIGRARGMHGTLLINTDFGRLSEYLNPSRMKLEAKGISSVRSRVMNLSEAADISVDRMIDAISEAFRNEYGETAPVRLTENDKSVIGRMAEKNSSWEWIFGRSPEFDVELENRFSFGELQLKLKLRGGRIQNVYAYTDSLDTALPDELSELLTGCPFAGEALEAALKHGGENACEIAEYIGSYGGF